MKNIVKGQEPEYLRDFRQRNPNGTWDKQGQQQFTNNKSRYRSVLAQLKADQGNLCAYCEISLLEADNAAAADRRIEHFHPKSDTSTAHNWALDWKNLLACCHGGSRRQVAQPHRYTSPDNSCDIPKADKNLDAVILNPLHLPAHPLLFAFDVDDGSILVDVDACNEAGFSPALAQNTINELRLDANRLRKFRAALLDDLKVRLLEMQAEHGLDDAVAKTLLAEDLLLKDDKGYWQAFFSTIRFYLLPESDEVLRQHNYVG